MLFTLPTLPYPSDALEPYIDTITMEIHHGRHHRAYVNNLNKALESAPQLANATLEDLLANNCTRVPENIRTAVRNNGGGHANHSIFWKIMAPNAGGKPQGQLARAIENTFGSFDSFKEQFTAAALEHFGSGWAWVVRETSDRLRILSTVNQDSPIMDGLFPLLGVDVWEHAYYLKYRNRRADYVSAWWHVINWKEVERRFETERTARLVDRMDVKREA
jgi:Fe-Mn family superoxide dismutase